ncbi:MAG TPA: helix-turn-helix domain-containing protein [Haliscomenobacter sp.]|uniref:helix-turn-helix domain-containing protein n=1 Tax=Haliscomenobacter sp. TaxID=2717303 RepID=UPI002CE1E187|nr:helix-turn-helix domain-containing protein [Haliscomenobacter sp.]HOY18288.1 helix-turn-helix domain-containing protein [Haliscomenobacter sp.]
MVNLVQESNMLINTFSAASFMYLGYILWLKSYNDNTLANRWMALFLLFVGFLQLDDALGESGFYLQHPHLFNLLDLSIFAVSPILYFSVFHFTLPEQRISRRTILHFIPTFLLLLLSLPIHLLNRDELIELIKSDEALQIKLGTVEIIFYSILFMQCSTYLIFSLRKILRHQKQLRKISSNSAKTDLNWLKFFWIGISLMLLLWIAEVVFLDQTVMQQSGWGYLICCYYLGFYATKQKEIFPYAQKDLEAIAEIIQDKSHEVKPETEIEFQQKEQLRLLLEEKKPYLDPELSLPKLAQMMNCSTHELSSLINRGFERNFYQLINAYRIEESKRLLLEERLSHLNILAIGFEAGFNSKTTFNTTFKNHTGISPLEYRKRHMLGN